VNLLDILDYHKVNRLLHRLSIRRMMTVIGDGVDYIQVYFCSSEKVFIKKELIRYCLSSSCSRDRDLLRIPVIKQVFHRRALELRPYIRNSV
jgi:hypothetical protein